jgi:uncharacterized membrane protein
MKGLVNRALTLAGALSAGMLLMYLFDPELGRRRRAQAADQIRSLSARASALSDEAARDAANRGRGIVATARAWLRSEPVAAQTLEERVRACIGHAVSNPHAVEVQAGEDGSVVLSGPILKSDQSRLMAAVWRVRGVEKVESRLQLYDEPGNVPALQGAVNRPEREGEDWPPSLRVAGSVAGALVALAGLAYRPLRLFGPLLGSLLLARSISNKSLGRMAGLKGPGSIHIDKDLFIAAPPDKVFAFWQRQENFPQFMRNVLEVTPLGDDRWHWKVIGPLGTVVEWDAQTAECEPGRCLAWHSTSDSVVEHEGRVEFEPEGEGTRLHVAMNYAPAGGVAGHAVARLFGKDAKTEMDEDLQRMKSFLETGVVPHDAAASEQHGESEGSRGALH